MSLRQAVIFFTFQLSNRTSGSLAFGKSRLLTHTICFLKLYMMIPFFNPFVVVLLIGTCISFLVSPTPRHVPSEVRFCRKRIVLFVKNCVIIEATGSNATAVLCPWLSFKWLWFHWMSVDLYMLCLYTLICLMNSQKHVKQSGKSMPCCNVFFLTVKTTHCVFCSILQKIFQFTIKSGDACVITQCLGFLKSHDITNFFVMHFYFGIKYNREINSIYVFVVPTM